MGLTQNETKQCSTHVVQKASRAALYGLSTLLCCWLSLLVTYLFFTVQTLVFADSVSSMGPFLLFPQICSSQNPFGAVFVKRGVRKVVLEVSYEPVASQRCPDKKKIS